MIPITGAWCIWSCSSVSSSDFTVLFPARTTRITSSTTGSRSIGSLDTRSGLESITTVAPRRAASAATSRVACSRPPTSVVGGPEATDHRCDCPAGSTTWSTVARESDSTAASRSDGLLGAPRYSPSRGRRKSALIATVSVPDSASAMAVSAAVVDLPSDGSAETTMNTRGTSPGPRTWEEMTAPLAAVSAEAGAGSLRSWSTRSIDGFACTNCTADRTRR